MIPVVVLSLRFELPEADGGGTQRYLYKDYSVDCDSDRYSGFIAYAVIMILVYPIGARGLAVQNIQGTPALIRLPPRSTGIPVFYGALLFKSRETLRDSGAMGRELANGFPTVGHLMFLVEAYKRTLRRRAELLPSQGGHTASSGVSCLKSGVYFRNMLLFSIWPPLPSLVCCFCHAALCAFAR